MSAAGAAADQAAAELGLSAPILEAAPGVLLLPLVGRLDGERSALVARRLLHAIARRPTRALVFDLTGMEATDNASGLRSPASSAPPA